MTDFAAFEARVRTDLDTLNLNRDTWVRQRDGVVDVVIVGAGQSGMAAALGLRMQGVTNVVLLDENPAGYEGPWDTYARMITLRTPKELTSIDLGIPNLTFRAWWTAQHGHDSWTAIDKIPREDWMAYLRWYRKILDLPVQNDTKVTHITPAQHGVFTVTATNVDTDETRPIKARKVILATGIQGGGEWHTPGFVKDALPANRYAHTSQAIDYAAMAGKRIAILGGGASAFDNAQYALKAGVGAAHVFIRKPKLPQINVIRFMEQTGVTPRFSRLDDAHKYEILASFMHRNQPPTNDTFNRAAALPGFALHEGSPWKSLRMVGDGVEITTPKGQFTYDFLVLSTGLVTDSKLRPELADLADSISVWADHYSPPANIANPVLDAHPYLTEGFAFTPKTSAQADQLHGLFCFNFGALMSHSLSAAALSGLAYAAPKLAQGVADQLFQDDLNGWMNDYMAYDEPEFVGEWQPDDAQARGAKAS